jgi:CRISPR/Cas system-associated exonuclease Cas4 (RecB family)
MNGVHIFNILAKVHTYKVEELEEVACFVSKAKTPAMPKLCSPSCLKYEHYR